MLHDGGVLLSFVMLLAGLTALAFRLRALFRRAAPLQPLEIPRMLAVLGALGGFIAYLREPSLSHRLQDLFVGGLAALVWMALVLLESLRKSAPR